MITHLSGSDVQTKAFDDFEKWQDHNLDTIEGFDCMDICEQAELYSYDHDWHNK